MSEEQQVLAGEAATATGSLAPDEDVRPEDLLARLRERVADPSADWRRAVVEAMAQWPLARESVGERRFVYLIGGEAFDWRALADRLIEACCEEAPEAEREEMLTGSGLPANMGEDEWMRTLGVEKYRAHLNYVYGVTVEQALQVAVQEEICKRNVGNGYMPGETECERAYERLYGSGLTELWAEFREEVPDSSGEDKAPACAPVDAGAESESPGPLRRRSGHASTGRSTSSGRHPVRRSGRGSECVAESDEFAYWLFKRRVVRLDPARVASDTRKGLLQLEKMRRAHARRLGLARQAGRRRPSVARKDAPAAQAVAQVQSTKDHLE